VNPPSAIGRFDCEWKRRQRSLTAITVIPACHEIVGAALVNVEEPGLSFVGGQRSFGNNVALSILSLEVNLR
jgi:hypothetical protein